MTYTKTHDYRIVEFLEREDNRPDSYHRYWDMLDREEKMILFRKLDDPILKNCREHYMNGLGTRDFDKLCEINFRMEKYETVLGYTTDKNNKVIRVFVNKYMDTSPEGDEVRESILWPPEIGKPSKLLRPRHNKTFYYS
jgi:hypothetical protein